MGIFGRIKGVVSSRANAAIDRHIDPAKELDLKIEELDAAHRSALQELVSYRASIKLMEQELVRLGERESKAEQRAMAAVRTGDDELARRCLKDVAEARADLVRVRRDRDEVAGQAVLLNRSRKELEPKLQMLKLRKGTLATQLAVARSGHMNPLGIDEAPFERLAAAEDRIDADAVRAEVDLELGGGAAGSDPALEARMLEAESRHGGDDALAELKARMVADRAKKTPG
jgi:phage shock protein A